MTMDEAKSREGNVEADRRYRQGVREFVSEEGVEGARERLARLTEEELAEAEAAQRSTEEKARS